MIEIFIKILKKLIKLLENFNKKPSCNKLMLIQDIELDNLNDENDFLETRKYSDTLQEIIKTTHTPCTIGLFGEWGSGKSSIIRDVINKLDFSKSKQHCEDTNEKIRFVVYDAWKYSHDSFRRTFLLEVAKELKLNYISENDRFYTNKTQDSKVSQKFNWKYFGIFLLFFIVVLIIFVCLEKIELLSLDYLDKVSIIAFLSFIATFSKNILSDYKTTIQEPLMFAPEQFENEFDNMHSIVFEKYNVDNEPFSPILHVINIDKLVIVVDNLDRCNADTVCEMLSDIKGFLNKDKVVFIVPLDNKMLKKHLEKNNDYDESESSEYLRKIFDCVLSLKKTQEFDMYEVLDKLLKNYHIEYNPNTMSVISEEYASNPRRVIKFINNFEIEKELLLRKRDIDEEFIKTNETLIAFLLILKEEQYSLYQKILENISNIHTIGDGSGKEDGDNENKSEDIKTESIENIYMKKFLEHTKIIWSKADLNVVDKVVCNLNTEDKLPYEIREKLEKNEFGKIKQEEYAEVSKHLVFGFNKWCERGAYKTNALSFFKQLIKANAYKMLRKNHFDDIYNKSEYALKELLEYLEDEEDIEYAILFIKSSNDNGYKDLYDYYSKKLKEHYHNLNKDNGYSKFNSIKSIYKIGFEYFLRDIKHNDKDLGGYRNYLKSYLENNYYGLKIEILDDNIIKDGVLTKLAYTKYSKESKSKIIINKLYEQNKINKSYYCISLMNTTDVEVKDVIETFKKEYINDELDRYIIDNYINFLCSKNQSVDEFIYVIEKKRDYVGGILYLTLDSKLDNNIKLEILDNISNMEELGFVISDFSYISLDRKLANFMKEQICSGDNIEKLVNIYSSKYFHVIFEYLYKDIVHVIIGNDNLSYMYQKLILCIISKDGLEIKIKEEMEKYIKGFVLNDKKLIEKLTPEFKETFLKGEQDA